MIIPSDVTSYTVFEAVKNRPAAQLQYDIVQAAQDIYAYAGHQFTDPKYTILPSEVKLAFIKLSEYYALVNSDESLAKGVKSEKIGDYTYQLGDKVQTFSLESLLSSHIEEGGIQGAKMTFKMRSL